VLAIAGVFAALGVSACCHPAAQEIYSVPRVACSGQPFLLRWTARGRGTISARPKPQAWTDLSVEDSGEHSLSIQAPTTFTLTVSDAKPRDQSRSADVSLLTSAPDRSAQVQCDVPGKVYGTFSLADVPDGVRVRKLHNPYVTADGKRADREVCVSHLNQTRCVPAGQSIELDEPAQGTWQLSLPSSPVVDCESGPGKLGIQLDFECH
jgi:hypothetical protein